jgi:ferrous iron transport protein B
VAALLFIMFYSPCFITIICIAREASWRWALFSMTFNTAFAFILAIVFYQVARISGLG